MKYFPEIFGKRQILGSLALPGSLAMNTAPAKFRGGLPLGEQRINVFTGIYPAILMDGYPTPGKAEGGKPIVLGDNEILWAQAPENGKVYTVSAFVNDENIGTGKGKFVGCVT